MRMPTSKLYRAFPELDPFDDERCVRFVRAAQGKWWRRAMRWIGLVVFAVVSFAGLGWGLTDLATGLLRNGAHPNRAFGPISPILGQAACLAIALLIGGLASLVLRDVLLRRSVRRVLKGSADCWNCGYRLLGLPVSAENSIRCPECGSVSRVDASVSELSVGPAAVDGSTELIAERPAKIRWWQSQRVRRRIAFGAGFLVLLPIGWEAHIQWQAAQARRINPGTKALMQHVLGVQGTGAADADAWSVAVSAAMSLEQAERNVRTDMGGGWPRFLVSEETRKRFEAGEGQTAGLAGWLLAEPEMNPEYTSVLEPPRGTTGEEARYYREAGEVARKVLESTHLRETTDRLARLRMGPGGISAVAGMRTLPTGKDLLAATILMPELWPLQRLGAMQAGRVQIAAAAGDIEECLSIIEEGLTVAQVVGDQPFAFDRQTASVIQARVLGAAAQLLDQHLTLAQLERFNQLLHSRTIRTDLLSTLDGERLLARSNVCWVFSNPNRARFGLVSPAFVRFAKSWGGPTYDYPEILEVWTKQDLGSLDRNLSLIDAISAHHRAQAALPAFQRGGYPAALARERDRLVLASFFEPSLHWMWASYDHERLQLVGLRVRVALERHRLTHGAYPDTLDQLNVPMNPVPIDPMSGQAILYKRVDPKTDKFGLAYLLYVPGPDGTDNGGVRATPPANRASAVPWRELPSGADYVLNDPQR